MISFILVEGPDGSGKSTLVKALSEKTGMPIEHIGAPPKPPYEYLMERLLANVQTGAIFDRFHAGSFVYGNAFRSMDAMDPFDYWMLEGYLLSRNSFLIYCRPTDDVLDKNLERGPDDSEALIYEDPAKYALVRQLYDIFISSRTYLPYFSYDYTGEKATEEAMTAINDLLVEFAQYPLPSPAYLGNGWSPDLALVGGVKDLKYLHRVMVAGGIQLNRVCITEELTHVPDAWENTDVVAVTKEAAASLQKNGIKYRLVPSPDWVAVNNYRDMLRYAKVLLGEEEWESKVIAFPNLQKSGFVIA